MQKSISCLLVDDDKDDQEIFRFALKKVNPAVSCLLANDGVFALEQLQEDTAKLPEFIFIDINMPRLNGIQVLGELKKIDGLKQIPVYMYSTSGQPDIVQKCKKMGAADFIVKSANLSDLEEALRGILKDLRISPVAH